MNLSDYVGTIQATSWLFQRALAALYLVAFISALKQFPALLGEKGLLPVPEFLQRVPLRRSPSIFHFHYSDRFLKIACWSGIVVAAAIMLAVPDHLPWSISTIGWLFLWATYLSIVNVGQTFYSFGWESMLLEAGFFAAFLGPGYMVAPVVPFLVLRWMLFRVEIGAGLIKLRNDPSWLDLTALYYHYETQPLPNPLSWYFHRFPKWVHRSGVFFSHVVQVLIPFGLFAPQPIAGIAGLFIIAHQLLLIVSGNYSWLNWITVCLGFTAFSDQFIRSSMFGLPSVASAIPFPPAYDSAMMALLAIVILLSIQPTANLFAKNQLMNFSYNPFHLINTYGAFGSMSRQRFEVIVEGTLDSTVDQNTEWKEYEFKAKPGSLKRMPPQVAPYHLRLDWLMWFLPFSVVVRENNLMVLGYERWFLTFAHKLLLADEQTLRLLRANPFKGAKPMFVRARYYLYKFATDQERKETGAWWSRELVGEYMPPVNLTTFERTSSVTLSSSK